MAIEVNKKDWSKLKDEEKISYCESLLKDAKSGREKRDLEWYLNHRFKEGDHYLSYNTVTSSLEANPPKRRGEVRMVVNKVKSSTRAVQNYVTAQKPKWEVVPGDIDEDTIKNARVSGKLLDYIYTRLHLEGLISGSVENAMDFSVAWVEVDWDENADGGMGQVRVRLQDTFDVWVDKRASIYRGRLVSRFLAKTVTRSLDEVKNDKRYDEKVRKKIKPDDEPAESRMKAKIIRKDYGNDEDKIPRVIVKEFMLWDDERNKKGGNITLLTYANDMVLREEPLDETEYPVIPFQISMNPLKIYQRAWTSDAIPLNKALDRSVSQKIMYVNQALLYRIIAEKGHGAGTITNEQGEIIEINPGRNFEQMPVSPLPIGFDRLSTELATYIEDMLGAHDAALGRLPSGARSGKTLEALQAADSNNLTGIVQSLESFLSVVGERVLSIIAKKYVASRVIKLAEPEEGQEYARVIGEQGERKSDVSIVTEDNEVIVKIGSWLGYTKEAQVETLKELAGLGIIPAEEVLRQLEFPNVEELSAKARDQRLEQGQMDLAIAGHAGGGGQPQEQGVDMVALADKENMQMAQGQPLPPTEGATPDHSQAHRDFLNSQTGQQLPDEVKGLIYEHYQGEVGGFGGAAV